MDNETPESVVETSVDDTVVVTETTETPKPRSSKRGRTKNGIQRDKVESITGVPLGELTDREIENAGRLSSYIEDMAPDNDLSDMSRTLNQRKLYVILMDLLNVPSDRFSIVFNWYIAAVRNSRIQHGAFDDHYIMRYHSMLSLSPSQIKLYQRILNLIINTADRRGLKATTLIPLLETLPNQESKDKLLTHFSN